MRQFGPPFPVKPFCAVMAHSDDELIQTQKLLKPLLGEVESASTPYTVSTFTQYYENEMGTELRKQFLAFRGVKSVADMNQFKFFTADIEDQFRENGNRTINLDPGYLTLDKLVLYTTKNFTHRIYLEHGLFAEITLTYSRTGWRTHSWTYPDFQTPEALTFFTQMRQELYHQLQATGDLPGFKMK